MRAVFGRFGSCWWGISDKSEDWGLDGSGLDVKGRTIYSFELCL